MTFSKRIHLRPVLGLTALLGVLLLAGCASRMPMGDAMLGAGEAAPATQLINDQVIEAERRERALSIDRALASLIVRDPPPYLIERGDILSIVVWDHPELAGQGLTPLGADPGTPGVPPAGFVVDHDGRIQLPLAGLVKVSGMTAEQARALVVKSLARYLASPNVTLRVQAYRSKRVYIDGEVRTPGLQAINDIPMTLVEALNRAGGMLPSADQSRIVLERRDLRYQIDLRSLVQKGVNPGTVLLVDGDVVRIHSRDESKVFVSGEVMSPRALTMHNGRLTLNEALGESGGISPTTGDARQVYVIRKTTGGTQVFQLDARRAGALAMAEAFELRPKDLVYVAASPLANWHRNLSMLFPGALSQAIGVTNRP